MSDDQLNISLSFQKTFLELTANDFIIKKTRDKLVTKQLPILIESKVIKALTTFSDANCRISESYEQYST